MHTEICDRLGIEFPIFAFTHCRDVVAAVSNAGGIGVLGAIGFSPEELEIELDWLDEHVGDHPYGVDIVIPGKYEGMGELDPVKLEAQLQVHGPRRPPPLRPAPARRARHPRDPADEQRRSGMMGWTEATGKPLLDGGPAPRQGARSSPTRWAPPRPTSSTRSKASGRMIGALAGSVKHALHHKEAGLDFIVCQGTEGGGHTGEIGSPGAVARGHRRRGPAPGPGRRRGGHAAARSRRRWPWAPRACGPAPCGSRSRRPTSPPGQMKAYLAATSRRHHPVEVLHGQALPHAQERLDRGLGPRRHPRPPPHAAADDGGHRRRGRRATATPSRPRTWPSTPAGRSSGGPPGCARPRDVIYDLVEEYVEAVDRLSQTAKVEV